VQPAAVNLLLLPWSLQHIQCWCPVIGAPEQQPVMRGGGGGESPGSWGAKIPGSAGSCGLPAEAVGIMMASDSRTGRIALARSARSMNRRCQPVNVWAAQRVEQPRHKPVGNPAWEQNFSRGGLQPIAFQPALFVQHGWLGADRTVTHENKRSARSWCPCLNAEATI